MFIVNTTFGNVYFMLLNIFCVFLFSIRFVYQKTKPVLNRCPVDLTILGAPEIKCWLCYTVIRSWLL